MLFYIRRFFSYISILCIKGILSDKDIKRLLGTHIFIYPFKEENLKPASYNLTASKCAFIKVNEAGNEVQKLIVEEDKIVIPTGKTAIIETEESIYVSKWITGSYHSRVRLVNKGLGHIGTTLDPCFFGVSAIALHNTTKEDITIKVGESIATIVFYCLRSKSSGLHDNMTGRIDDNIRLDIKTFHDNTKNNKTKGIILFTDDFNGEEIDEQFIREKVKIINEPIGIKEKIIVVYNKDEVSCENCMNCNKKENCSYKLLKNAFQEESNRKKTIEDIKQWKSASWRINKDSLIKKVHDEMKIRDTYKDIVILSVITLGVGILVIVSCLHFISSDSKDLNEALKIIIGVTIPTVTLVIGMIANYKTKYKGVKEYETTSRKN